MRKHIFIYQTTNLLNNKKYVGAHSTDNIEDGYLGSGRVLKQALKKYGKEIFSREILEFCSIDNWQQRETHWIIENNTKSPNGYNISDGGLGVIGTDGPWNKGKTGIYSDETKRKWSEKRKGIPLSEEAKKKLSNTIKGRKKSKEWKAKLSESKKGEKNPMHGKDAWKAINDQRFECEFCGKITNKGNYVRWHGAKCGNRS